MKFSWRQSSNKISGTSRVSDINNYIKKTKPSNKSAIDNFYDSRTKIIQVATPTFLNSNPWLSAPLIALTISATEDYFREISAFCITKCSIAKAASAEKSIHLGSAMWNSASFFSRGCFEHLSFASQDTVKKCSREYLDYEINKKSNTYSALEEYEKLCELRHGIVHSNSRLPGKNAIKLGLQNTTNDLILIEPGVTEIQEAISICSTLIESYNQELFQEICRRWANDWRNDPGWVPQDEGKLFKDIYEGFFSSKNPPHSHTWRKSMSHIKKEFGLP
ncbi:hypothetical protein NOX82_10070 [Pseudomonas citronellolis]|uniref:hypothetical protein n=1 Tax=Pseudomonas citronellolis TaxID=53408 RepID=UPI0021126BDF|nr:hypothetical protein [Pseudomonas citronellolis]UUC52235.1 hypothetical protein NOX82_10070 [Pseudomonas citronellolis]